MTYEEMIVADAPVSYWRLGEAVGASTAVDEMGANDGTYTSGPTLGATSLVAGDTDTSVDFDGSNDHIVVTDSASLDWADVFSYEGWMEPDDVSTTQSIYMKGSGPPQLAIVSATLQLFQSSTLVASSKTVLVADTKYHFVVTKDAAVCRVYVNGNDVTVTGTNATCTNNATNLNIGRNTAGTQHFNGTLDDLAVYNYALTAQQVRRHFLAGGLRPATVGSLTLTPA